jgi:putative serine/threonine protein kinase
MPSLLPKNPTKVVLRPRDLDRKEHGPVLCYPGTDLASFRSRISQLKSLGVENLILEGDSKVGKFGIIGRGCVSTVVKASLSTEKRVVALKIRRVDANRPDMQHDFELQKYANSFGVGPKAIAASKDLFAMEYIPSVKLGSWFQSLKTRSSKKYLRALIRGTLEQCFLLDLHGLDHGELSNPTKHVLLRRSLKAKSVIIDYESASRNRKPANLTCVAQFFFLGGWQSAKVRKILGFEGAGAFGKEELIARLRAYKEQPSRNVFEDLMSNLRC